MLKLKFEILLFFIRNYIEIVTKVTIISYKLLCWGLDHVLV